MIKDFDSLETQLAEAIDSYDLSAIVHISKQLPADAPEEWRQYVLESGFLVLLSYLEYDQMCGKLSDGGLDFMDEVIEEAEKFYGSPLPFQRAQVLYQRFEEVEDTDTTLAQVYLRQAIAELTDELEVHPDNSLARSLRARSYDQQAQLDVENVYTYWKSALDDINKLEESIELKLWILYHSWEKPDPSLLKAQELSQKQFEVKIEYQLTTNPDLIWQLLEGGIRILEWKDMPELKEAVSMWLDQSLDWYNPQAKPSVLRSAGLLLSGQGKKHQRVDYLDKAAECFEQFIQKEPAHAMEVYYLAEVWKSYAEIIDKQGDSGLKYIAKAWLAYREHEEIVKINFSPLFHYAEFMEQLYYRDDFPNRPSAEEVLSLAEEVEEAGNGHYSGPGMIQVRMALVHNDMDTALYHLNRLLLRFELLIDNQIKTMYQTLPEQAPQILTDFLRQAVDFMEEITPNYCYDPKYSQAELNQLTREETKAAWQARMDELRQKQIRSRNYEDQNPIA
ncbi:hypothetical protein QNI16_02450 [Cytophagaceae bacterium YF14B1]|uniref:Tetratricopeptide repeat protein n=1 Tax=Xanthocytophaga flava TaxID=3048013 RepID=A0AAE3U5A1_9BACT|nr:hypothetical protein [Xanthocytophaga flavus]MDJ1479327.1 hypothetical protein [Xanthocytophaga flavus]